MRAIIRDQWIDGHLANVLVPKNGPLYAAMLAIVESGEVPVASRNRTYGTPSMRECARFDTAGIWVPHCWLPDRMAR